MSYLALARKWRPRRFEDVMGQQHVVRALSHALDNDRLHPAILLTGTRGVGKTTLARILAKGLNCSAGVTSQPCGTCDSCTAVDAGRFVDLLEIDAASNTGVDNIRELIENAQYPPVLGRYKVYLIDEVHMLSKAAFNALLKTLEEPPAQVKFVLATTDPQKLLVTVLSRCLQFNLKRLPVAVIREQLGVVLGQEGIASEPQALGELARAADGSMRDGLSLLDQAIAFAGGGALTRELIEDMLGTVGRQRVYELLAALADGDSDALLALIAAIDAQSPDFAALLNELAAALQRIAVLQMLPSAQSEDDDEALLALVPRIPPEDVQLYYQISIHGRRDLPWAPDPRLGFEMTVLRMLAFRPDDGTSPPAGGGTARPMARPAAPAPAEPLRKAPPPVSVAAAPAPAPPPRPAVADGPEPAAATARAPEQGPAIDWEARVDALEVDGATRNVVRQCAWRGMDGDTVRLAIAAREAALISDAHRQSLAQALGRQFGRSIAVVIDTVDVQAEDLESPAQLAVLRATQRQRDAEASIAADPAVRAFADHFGAQPRAGSIRPHESRSGRLAQLQSPE